MNTRPPRTGLYLLTPDEPDTGRLLARLRPLLATGIVALLQLRNKAADDTLRRAQALALLAVCHEHGVPLVINDDWRLAAELGVGAHLGAGDGDLAPARAALGPDAILGATCHGDIGRAVRARDAGASYLAFGAFFASGTKPDAARVPLSVLRQARALALPTVAIGGITPDNAAMLVAAGADWLAVLGAVFDAADPVAALHAFRPLISPRPDLQASTR